MKELSNKALWDKIENLDLRPIIHKLTHPDEKYGWSKEVAYATATAYQKYLYLAGTYGQTESIVPSKIIDEFWHMHILDTQKYAEDCQNLFGTMLHHYPYLGIRFIGDRGNLENAFKKTQTIWQETFGDTMSQILSSINEKELLNLKDLITQAENCDTCGSGSCAVTSCGSNSCSGFTLEEVPEFLQR